MQALQIDHHGPASDLRVSDVPRPVPGPDDVLIEVEAAAINPSDIGSAAGRFPQSPLPRILGRDFAGRVSAGPADLVGQRVWGTGGDLGIARDGAHAEYIAIPRAAVALRPSPLSAEEAAAVGVPYGTAWAALHEKGGLQAGEWVIISGAAGAVGSAAIQIAAAHQARIIALVRNAEDDPRLAREKVAAIAYSEQNNLVEVVQQVTGGKGADLAINGVGGAIFQPLLDALAETGRMVVFSVIGGREVQLDLFPFYRANLTLYGLNTAGTGWDAVHGARSLDQLRPLFESGALAPPPIAERYPLSQAAVAYQRVADGQATGKVVLIPDRLFQETPS